MSSQRRVANLPLHGGKAPKWLFHRIVKLTAGIVDVMLMNMMQTHFCEEVQTLTGFMHFHAY